MNEHMDDKFLNEAKAILEKGGLVVIPTETFYGIACDARSEKAANRLVTIKGREEGKPIPLIAGDKDIVKNSVSYLPVKYQRLANEFWPGALTMVLPSPVNFPVAITAGTRTVGIRVPGPSFARELARAFRGPITATSANRAGQQPPQSAGGVRPAYRRDRPGGAVYFL